MYHEHSSWSAFYILLSLFLLPRFVRPPHPRKVLYLNLGRQPRAAPLILKSCVEEALAGRSVPCPNCYNLGGISNFLACSFLSRHNARAVWGSHDFFALIILWPPESQAWTRLLCKGKDDAEGEEFRPDLNDLQRRNSGRTNGQGWPGIWPWKTCAPGKRNRDWTVDWNCVSLPLSSFLGQLPSLQI